MSYAGEVIATVPLVAAESVSRSEMLSFISQGTSVLTSPWFLLIMGIILLLVIVYIILILLYRRNRSSCAGCAATGICDQLPAAEY